MFRKKKVLGSVTIFPDNDETAASRFNDLEDEATEISGELHEMSAFQIRQLLIASAQAGTDTSARALQTVHEARKIGMETAETMQQQTRQLERTGNDFEIVQTYLDKSERTLMLLPTNVRNSNIQQLQIRIFELFHLLTLKFCEISLILI